MGMSVSFTPGQAVSCARATVRLLAAEMRRTLPTDTTSRAQVSDEEQDLADAIGGWSLNDLNTGDLKLFAELLADIERRYPEVVSHWNPAGRHILLTDLGKIKTLLERRRGDLAGSR
jgi:hypothetical protein